MSRSALEVRLSYTRISSTSGSRSSTSISVKMEVSAHRAPLTPRGFSMKERCSRRVAESVGFSKYGELSRSSLAQPCATTPPSSNLRTRASPMPNSRSTSVARSPGSRARRKGRIGCSSHAMTAPVSPMRPSGGAPCRTRGCSRRCACPQTDLQRARMARCSSESVVSPKLC